MLVEGLHAVLVAGVANVGVQLAGEARILDQVTGRVRADHDFDRRGPPMAVGARQQPLRDHALERLREAHPRDLLLLGREHRHQAADGRCRVRRVQRRDDEMPRLGGLQRGFDRLHVPHLADQDDVRVLPQRGAKARREVIGIHPDLALRDGAVDVAMQELDRVLERDHVLLLSLVDVVHDRGHGGALPRAGDPRDENQPSLRRRDRAEDGWQLERLKRGDIERDDAHHDHERRALPQDVDPEAPDPRHPP